MNEDSQSAEFREKQSQYIKSRMRLARQWIILGLCYYLLRAIIVIFPYWSKESYLQKVFIVVQAVVAIAVILIVI